MSAKRRRDFDDDWDEIEQVTGDRSGSWDNDDEYSSLNNYRRGEEVRKLNIFMLIFSLILGFVMMLPCIFVYELLVDLVPRPLVIGAVFGLLAFGVCTAIHIASILSRCFDRNLAPGRGGISPMGAVILGTLAVAALGTLFQWIYGLHVDPDRAEPTSYVFVIDNSGSMDSSDPDGLRFSAISQVLEDYPEDFPYMVYGFSQDAYVLREMKPASQGDWVSRGETLGLTSIRGSLETVIKDYRNDVWEGGDHPKVILLTDGYATDINRVSEINGTLRDYVSSNISISTIGLGYVDERLMENIATGTGGVFIDVNDASMLSEAMSQAASSHATDDLLTTRFFGRLDFLFGLLRILFLAILGGGIAYMKSIAYGNTKSYRLVIFSGMGQAALGAVIMEVFTSLLGLPSMLCWTILWLLIGLTVCTRNLKQEKKSRKTSGKRDKASRFG